MCSERHYRGSAGDGASSMMRGGSAKSTHGADVTPLQAAEILVAPSTSSSTEPVRAVGCGVTGGMIGAG